MILSRSDLWTITWWSPKVLRGSRNEVDRVVLEVFAQHYGVLRFSYELLEGMIIQYLDIKQDFTGSYAC